MRARIIYAAAAALAACSLAGCQSAAEAPHRQPAETAQKLAQQTVVVTTAKGERRYVVEVARTDEEQSRGLMFRESLAPDAGMLFPFRTPRRAVFWMRNTLIPLDIIFIRRDGTIARIAEMTTPLSLDPVDAGEEVVAVLEIAGGGARAAGIQAGDTVSWAGQPG